MVRVSLRVFRAPVANDDGRGEDWGEWDFVGLPQAGDHIDLQRNECIELLTVRRVVHLASQHPLPRSEWPYRQRRKPSICVIAVRAALTRAGTDSSAAQLRSIAPSGGRPGAETFHDPLPFQRT